MFLVNTGRMPWAFVLMLLRMRGQIAAIANRLVQVEEDLRRLYRSHEDLTAAYQG